MMSIRIYAQFIGKFTLKRTMMTIICKVLMRPHKYCSSWIIKIDRKIFVDMKT